MNEILKQIENITLEFDKDLNSKLSNEELESKYLGKDSVLSSILKSLGKESIENKKILGPKANDTKKYIAESISNRSGCTKSINIDLTVPASKSDQGSLHPVNQFIVEMSEIFARLGFEVVEGPEIVSDKDNFDALNFQPNHPARDSQDSLILDEEYLLRTHTSSMQVVELKKRSKAETLPARIIIPGKTYRRESDQTHSVMFHQIEGMIVDQQTTFADLKGVLIYFFQQLLGADVQTRFRPHYFPFTEPSAEFDILWTDKKTGQKKWLECGGCGMIHPNVLKNAGINPKNHQGWAFGLAVERPLMIRYDIRDIRYIYNNSLDYLTQFPNNII